MKSQHLHDELKIREKIQGLKTPVQDADWQHMLALLESDDTKGGAPLPDLPPPSGTAQVVGRYRRLLPVLLVLLIAGAWWMAGRGFRSPDNSALMRNSAAAEQGVGQLPPGREGTKGLDGNGAAAEQGVGQLPPGREGTKGLDGNGATAKQASALPASHPDGAVAAREMPAPAIAPTLESPEKTLPTATRRQKSPKTEQTAYIGLAARSEGAAGVSAPPPAPADAPVSANAPASGQAGTATAPGGPGWSVGTQEPATAPPALVADMAVLWPLPPVESPLLSPLKAPDSLVRPTARLPRIPRRFQRGLILGLNANMVNYDALRLSVMPQVGYHISMPLARHYRFQAECQLKYVSNYQEHAAFAYVAPGSRLDITWDLNHLFLVELPLLLKKEGPGIGGATWLAGLKPAWCTPIFPAGSYSISSGGNSPAPQAEVDLRDGVRWIDLGVVLGLEWRFARQWALDIRYNQGLFDLTHDNFFKNTTTHLNTDVQFTLRHYVQPYKNNRYAKHTFPGGPHRPDQQRGLQKRR